MDEGGVSLLGESTVRTHERVRTWRADGPIGVCREPALLTQAPFAEAAQSGLAELAAEPVSAGEGSRCGRMGEAAGRPAGAATAAADSSALMWS